MKLNKYLFITLNSLIIAFTFYIAGCISSPETTTGKLAFQQKDFPKAETELTKGVASDKEDIEAWYMLGVSRIEVGKFEEARVCFDKSKSAFGFEMLNYWILKYNDGIKAFNEGLGAKSKKDSVGALNYFSKSLMLYRAATIIIPDSIICYQMMGDCYAYIGKADSAITVYSSILDKSKSKDDAINIAKLMYQSGIKSRQAEQYESAIDMFKKILTIPYLPKDNVYYESSQFNTGFCYYMIAEKVAKENGDYKPLLQNAVNYLEPLTGTLKDKDLLGATYELLINAYDALGLPEKAEEAKKKKAEIPK